MIDRHRGPKGAARIAEPRRFARNAVTLTGREDTPVDLHKRTGTSTARSDDFGVSQGNPGLDVYSSASTCTSKTTAPTGMVSFLLSVTSLFPGIVCGTRVQLWADASVHVAAPRANTASRTAAGFILNRMPGPRHNDWSCPVTDPAQRRCFGQPSGCTSRGQCGSLAPSRDRRWVRSTF